MTSQRPDPAERLAELLETLPPAERQEMTAWLLGRLHARGTGAAFRAWPLTGEAPSRLTGSLPVGEDSQLVTIRLPADRHARLRAWCAEHGFTMAAVVRGLVE